MPAKPKKSAKQTTRVLRLRLKDKHAAALQSMARDVNFVWNYANDLSFKVWQRERRFLSEYDIDKYTAGATKEGLNLHSTTVQAVSKELVTRRVQHKKVKLRWRVSRGSRRSLGWIPFKASHRHGWRNLCSMLAGRCSGPCCSTSAMTPACGSKRSTKRIQPRPVLRATHAAARKG